jgi:hypothetical protein
MRCELQVQILGFEHEHELGGSIAVLVPLGNTCRCFATLTFPLDGFLGLVSEAFAWHCFAIQSQHAAPCPLAIEFQSQRDAMQ